jgi:hypothetical protein
LPLPICDAITTHRPEVSNETVAGELEPEMLQTVPPPSKIDNVGANPEEVLADTVYVPPGTGFVGTCDVKFTVCAARPTVITMSTDV